MTDYIVGSRAPKPGEKVYIIQKVNYGTENYDLGIVKDVLTSRPMHPRGHKVRLTNGIIGRVQKFFDAGEVTPVQPKYETREAIEQPENLPNFLPDPDDLV